MNNENLTYREDTDGLYVYNVHTGLIYFIVKSESDKVRRWIQSNGTNPIDDIYTFTLGSGWKSNIEKSELHSSQILPSSKLWLNKFPEFPLTLNWFLTGSCPLDCLYCYAEDLMRNRKILGSQEKDIIKFKSPTLNEVKKISENILKINPLVVVLTGGDPLVSPHLKSAINLLYGKVGILVDTSGYIFNEEIATFFKEKNVSVRISLDSNDWNINNFQRPLLNKKHQRKRDNINNEVNAIKLCLDKKIPIIIQTVLTNKNYKSMLSFGDFLYDIGVKMWRIQVLQKPSSLIIKDNYNEIDIEKSTYFSLNELKELLTQRNKFLWNNSIILKFTENNKNNKNSVVLISPDGDFYTEGISGSGKFLIDNESPKLPSKKSILKFINNSGHLVRYLNIEL